MQKGIVGGMFLVVCGLAAFLGNTFGYENVGFLYVLALGLILIFVPGRDGQDVLKQRRRQVAGGWLTLTGLVMAAVRFTDLSWAGAGPLWLIGTGVLLIVTRASWTKQA